MAGGGRGGAGRSGGLGRGIGVENEEEEKKLMQKNEERIAVKETRKKVDKGVKSSETWTEIKRIRKNGEKL